MEREAWVYADLEQRTNLVGRLFARTKNNRDSATFEHNKKWLNNPNRFSLEPALILAPGAFLAGADRPQFGAIGDSAPDRWGRVLMRRAECRRAEKTNQTPRTLREIDYLLMVDDEARLGALRFTDAPDGQFLATGAPSKIPLLFDLPKLVSAAERVLDDSDSDEDLRLLLAPGSSLGGARPKASIRDRDGHLLIAKFPSKDDEFNTVLWEALALTLARKAGIDVPEWRVEKVEGKSVLLLRRFDRIDGLRIPLLSAISMLGAKDNESHSYLEFVDALRQYGREPKQEMHSLWRRIVFSILISNTDDHLRNHAFLYTDKNGWKLSPAYDLNPVPVDIKPRILTTLIDADDGTASLKLAMKVAYYFKLSPVQAQKTVQEVAEAVSTWRMHAARLGLTEAEITRMASAFEH